MSERGDEIPSGLFAAVLIGGPMAYLPYLRKSTLKTILFWVASSLFTLSIYLVLPLNWFWITLTLFSVHLFFFFILLRRRKMERSPPVAIWPGRLLQFFNIIAFAIPVSFLYAGMERWLSDFLWSSFWEVHFSWTAILKEYLRSVGDFLFFSVLCGLMATRNRKKWSVENIFQLLLIQTVLLFCFRQSATFLVSIPLRHTLTVELLPAWITSMREILSLLLLSIFGGTLISFLVKVQEKKNAYRIHLFRGLLALLFALLGLAILTGMPVHYGLVFGRQYEKYARISQAVEWYQRTFRWVQSPSLKSYLQFHLGLLERKKGQVASARQAFRNVLLKYNASPELVMLSKKFHMKLDQEESESKGRMVIPGVEFRTEYKAAYCVPNSMGLVLNYWGDKVGAKSIGKSITKLDEGSYITDEAYYAEERGFQHYVLPLRSKEDIIALIDRQIPVLVFIPGHVLAVFGYDAALETWITYDVATYEIWDERSWIDFSKEWDKTFNLMAVLIPKEKKEEIEYLLQTDLDKTNEAYLQFMIYTLSEDVPEKKLVNLESARRGNAFFIEWEYGLFTGKSYHPNAEDSAPLRYLLQPGVEVEVVYLYLKDLFRRGKIVDIVRFLKEYSKNKSLPPEFVHVLSISLDKLGLSEEALRMQIHQKDFPQLPPDALEYLAHRVELESIPQLALQVSQKILNDNPFNFRHGSTGAQAYHLWRKNRSSTSLNERQNLEMVYQYLKNWNPVDPEAVGDMALLVEKMSVRSGEDTWDLEVWKERLELYRSHAGVYLSQLP